MSERQFSDNENTSEILQDRLVLLYRNWHFLLQGGLFLVSHKENRGVGAGDTDSAESRQTLMVISMYP